MSANAIDSRFQFQLVLWYVAMAFGLLIAALLLAANQYLAALMLVGMALLISLPYHAKLAVFIATMSFSSAFIVPFVPGRPFVWEAAGVMAWTGVLLLILLKRFPPDLGAVLRRNRWVFLGLIVYCLTLVLLMNMRGFGIRALGGGQGGVIGGRFYLQQLICAIFPLLFAMLQLQEKVFVRLMLVQWLLASTYFISDFALSFGGGSDFFLYFLEVPGDALNFEGQAMQFGIRRFQSFQYAGLGLMLLLLAAFSLRDFLSGRRWWVFPLFVVIFGVSLLSGHRTIVFYIGGTLLVAAWGQRFFTARVLILGPLVAIFGLIILYSQARDFPLSVQRAISFLPGIQVDPQAAVDAAGTLEIRRVLRRVGIQMVPDYLWVGRGFAKFADYHLSMIDPTYTTPLIEQGIFFNGFVGLLVNTGLSGTVGMFLIILGGTRLAWRVLVMVRDYERTDVFLRTCCVLAGFWITSVFFFLFLHGDAEMALKSFALQIGALIMAERLLLRRVTPGSQASTTAPASQAQPEQSGSLV